MSEHELHAVLDGIASVSAVAYPVLVSNPISVGLVLWFLLLFTPLFLELNEPSLQLGSDLCHSIATLQLRYDAIKRNDIESLQFRSLVREYVTEKVHTFLFRFVSSPVN